MTAAVVDDHLLRDVLVGRRDRHFDGLASTGIATTGLWLFRLCSSFADPGAKGRLSAPVAALPEEMQAVFRAQLVALPVGIEVLGLRELAWRMAELQTRHRARGRAAAEADGIAFHVL